MHALPWQTAGSAVIRSCQLMEKSPLLTRRLVHRQSRGRVEHGGLDVFRLQRRVVVDQFLVAHGRAKAQAIAASVCRLNAILPDSPAYGKSAAEAGLFTRRGMRRRGALLKPEAQARQLVAQSSLTLRVTMAREQPGLAAGTKTRATTKGAALACPGGVNLPGQTAWASGLRASRPAPAVAGRSARPRRCLRWRAARGAPGAFLRLAVRALPWTCLVSRRISR